MMRMICVLPLVLCLFTFTTVARANGDGIVVGYDSHDGHILLNELKCTACHKAGDLDETLWDKHAPDLATVGSRITPQYLQKFLSAPHAVKPGTTMPDLLHGKGDKEKAEAADALTHYLAGLGQPIDQRSSGSNLAEIHRGGELFHTIGCVACHQPIQPPPVHKLDEDVAEDDDEEGQLVQAIATLNASIPLGDLARKTTVDELAKFLANPHEVRKSGRMPSLSLAPGEPWAIAAYLLRDQYQEDQQAPGVGLTVKVFQGDYSKMPDFSKLTPIYEGESQGLELASVIKQAEKASGKALKNNFAVQFTGMINITEPGEYQFWARSDDGTVLTIDGKEVINNDGYHPPKDKAGNIHLKAGIYTFELGFTQGGGGFEMATAWQPPGTEKRSNIPAGVLLHQTSAMIPHGIVDFKIDQAKAAQGRKLFASLGCASCHNTGEKYEGLTAARSLAELNPTAGRGCIGIAVEANVPKYDFNDRQKDAVRTALVAVQKQTVKLKPEDRLHQSLTVNNCYACHQRGEIGGPDSAKADYFVYEKMVDLGDEGRLPPPLHEVGAKLTKEGFDDMMFRDHKYRTYMATRMPRFGEANVGHMPEWFEQVDAGKVPAHEPEFSPQLVDDGRFLTGKKALSCINCHVWGDDRLPGAEGMDLLESGRRLKPSWFHAWLKDPQKMRPGTRMPTSWPQGQSFFSEIQDGNVDRQIDAVWAYLSVGNKAGYPPGLSPSDSDALEPADEPITFRTFLDGVSAHAILVGFRQRTHVAFDANRVRTVVAWTGPFITTKESWNGRAGQYAKIVTSQRLDMPKGPPLALLDSDAAPWPTDVAKTAQVGSRRTPPGWRFRGYRLDAERVPTFLYEAGKVHVAETFGTSFLRDSAHLKRTLKLTSEADVENLYFLAAEGKEIAKVKDGFVIDGENEVKVTTDGEGQPLIRTTPTGQQLLLPIKFNENQKNHTTTVEVEYLW